MPLTSQQIRAWKLMTGVISAGSAFHLVFQVDYSSGQDGKDHVFSDVQRWYQRTLDKAILGNQLERELNEAKIQIKNTQSGDQGQKNQGQETKSTNVDRENIKRRT